MSKTKQGVIIWDDADKNSGTSIFSWSGAVTDGYAEGDGTLKIYFNENNVLFKTYQGSLKKGKTHGKGIYTVVVNFKYEGDFVDNKFHGKGILILPNGDKYEGDWLNDVFGGYGILYKSDGIILQQGRFENGKFVG